MALCHHVFQCMLVPAKKRGRKTYCFGNNSRSLSSLAAGKSWGSKNRVSGEDVADEFLRKAILNIFL